VTSAAAQEPPPLLDDVEDMDFDRPEAWAMKYFGSISMLTPLGRPTDREPGSVELALEVIQVPHLSKAERTVGFNGRKEEDLNRLPVVVRPRLTIGLPAKLAIEVGYIPPVEYEGIEPNLVSLALERSFAAGEHLAIGTRLYGQIGEAEGDLICSDDDVAAAPGSPGNPFGCRALSNDETTLDHVGFHLGAGYDPGVEGGPSLLFGAAVTRHDLEFQIDAFTSAGHDRTLLRTEGTTYALTAGVEVPATERAQLGFEVLWSPLEVVRPPRTMAENDDLLHLRAAFRYRVR
jgi:hypothetical protein